MQNHPTDNRSGFKFEGFVLVILTSRFEATRGLFWEKPPNFKLRTDDTDDTRAGTHSLNFRTTPTRDPTYNLTCNRPNTRKFFRGMKFRTWNLSSPKTRPYH
ncbi:hypothetical protein AVEN_197252-1 [Araneus ventricosus]|uniref:Uncharacterized protein n=1 Tax=Araneus ventricosus TaxID=182803 RepID=A0A4Y2LMY0_ARAVE|nr:hypothetical protein AVEN_197252-1 [Araneus ventricosus]